MFITNSVENARIGVVGQGYTGVPLAVEFGKTLDALGCPARIDAWRAGVDSTCEKSPEELGSSTRLRMGNDIEDLRGCNVFIVTMPTPFDDAKWPDLRPLIAASETIGRALKSGDIVVHESTVHPDCTEEICVPILERASGLRYGIVRGRSIQHVRG